MPRDPDSRSRPGAVAPPARSVPRLPVPPGVILAGILLASPAPAGAVPAGAEHETPPADVPSSETPPADDDATPHPPRYIFAVEDTLEIPAFFRMTPIEIRADRLKIGEIVRRCIEREEELQDRIETHEYTVVAKSVFSIGGTGDVARRRMILEQADRKFFRKPDEERTIPLKMEKYVLENGERKDWDLEGDPSVGIRYGDLFGLPFYLREKDDYHFDILSREIVGSRVIYEVHLEPKSDFEIAPSGRIWVDTSSFQILREEFDFGNRVPMPMFVKSIGPFIRERERIGDLWVWKRFLVRVDLRLGYLRFLDEDLPDTAQFLLLFKDHRVNQGWSIDDEEGSG